MKRTALILSVLLSLQTGLRQPLWEPYDKTDDGGPKATVAREFVPRLSIGGFAVDLEQTTMTAAQAQLGGSFGTRGDAGEYLQWICRTATDADGRWILWLTGGEIHGGVVGAFDWRRIDATTRVDSRCSTAPRPEQVVLPVPISLGMSEARVVAVLGKPSQRRGNTLLYRHEHTEKPEFYVGNYLDVVIDRGVVAAIRVWRTTST
jgi:hypothetical protein